MSLGFAKEKTYLTNTTTEKIQAGNNQIFVYNASSRDSPNSLILECILQVDVSVPIANAATADKAIEQIIALVLDTNINVHGKPKLIAPSPVDLACQSGFYCKAARFSYYATTVNEIKTL